MQDRLFYGHISNYNLFSVKDFGVFHLSVAQASKIVTKIRCLDGDIYKELPEIPNNENYSLYDESLDCLLKNEIVTHPL